MVKWAKDPWRIKEVMKSLQDINDKKLNTDKEKAEGLIRNHFVWNKDSRILEGGKEEGEDGQEVEENKLEEMRIKVEAALGGTQNSSAPGSDGISYRFIKKVKERVLGEG